MPMQRDEQPGRRHESVRRSHQIKRLRHQRLIALGQLFGLFFHIIGVVKFRYSFAVGLPLLQKEQEVRQRRSLFLPLHNAFLHCDLISRLNNNVLVEFPFFENVLNIYGPRLYAMVGLAGKQHISLV